MFGKINQFVPQSVCATEEWSFFEMPYKRNSITMRQHMISKVHRSEIEKSINDVGLYLCNAFFPAFKRYVFHMSERQRPHRVVIKWIVYPQSVEFVPARLQRRYAFCIVGELADNKNLERFFIAVSRWDFSVSEIGIRRNLILQAALSRLESDRFFHPVICLVHIYAATHAVVDYAVALIHVCEPFATNSPCACLTRIVVQKLCPEHCVKIVGYEFAALHPSVLSLAVHHLHELQRQSAYASFCRLLSSFTAVAHAVHYARICKIGILRFNCLQQRS